MKSLIAIVVLASSLLGAWSGGRVEAADYTKYSEVLSRVKAGESLTIVIGAGGIEAPSPLTDGVWKCWRNESGEAKMSKVIAVQSVLYSQALHPTTSGLLDLGLARPLGLAPFSTPFNVFSRCSNGQCR